MSGGESTGNSHPTAARIKAQRANQIGAAANKMQVLTAGPAASTASGEFIRSAPAVNAAASRLTAHLTAPGLVPELPNEGNLVFVRLDHERVEALDRWYHVSRWDGKGLVRLACSFDHTTEEADRLATGIACLHR